MVTPNSLEPNIGFLGAGVGYVKNISDGIDGLIDSSDIHDAVSDDWDKLFF